MSAAITLNVEAFAPLNGAVRIADLPLADMPIPRRSEIHRAHEAERLPLSDLHRQLLIEVSGISPDVIEARGYQTLNNDQAGKKLRTSLGFGASTPLPALHIPWHDVDGAEQAGQLRPDAPRIDKKSKKPTKYEQPPGSRVMIDVPPHVASHLPDPTVPIYFTEGSRKADAAASHGLCCVSLSGVWNWVKDKTPISDFGKIDLRGRDVRIAFDSDAMENRQVMMAAQRLAGLITAAGGFTQLVRLPEGPLGEKTGLDDYFARGGTADGLEAFLVPIPSADELPERTPEKQPSKERPQYRFSNGATERYIEVKDDKGYWERLAGFEARIEEARILDDGCGGHSQVFRIKGKSLSHRGGLVDLPEVEVEGSKFKAMNWADLWIPYASIEPGRTVVGYLCHAIQELSQPIHKITVNAHLGWGVVQDQDAYCHAGGAIGASGTIKDAEVQPPIRYQSRILPAPDLSAAAIADGMSAARAFLTMGDMKSLAPVFASIWRSMLGPADFALYLHGPSGTFKSTVAQLAVSFFGESARRSSLLKFGVATTNAVFDALHDVKDQLLLLDDYKPGNQSGDESMRAVLQSLGDLSARDRSTQGGGMRALKAPRTLLLVTGEDIVGGSESTLARCFPVAFEKGLIDRAQLNRVQRLSRDGDFSRLAAAFAMHAARQGPEWRDDLTTGTAWEEARDRWQEALPLGVHGRTPEQAAHLEMGLRAFFDFARRYAPGELDDLETPALDALRYCANSKADTMRQRDPLRLVVEYTAQALSGGKAYLSNRRTGGAPSETDGRYGWRTRVGFSGPEPEAVGREIGFIDQDEKGTKTYLLLESFVAVVRQGAKETGDHLQDNKNTLAKMFVDRGLAIPPPSGPGHLQRIRVGSVGEGGSQRLKWALVLNFDISAGMPSATEDDKKDDKKDDTEDD